MRKEYLLIALVMSVMVLGTRIQDAIAQQPVLQTVQAGQVKIGIINLQRAISDSEKGKQVISKLKAEIDQAKAKLDSQKKDIEKLQEEYKAKQSTWDIATRQAKQEEITSKITKLNRDAEDYDRYYGKRRDDQMKPIVEGLNQVIIELGKKEGYSIIFDVSGGILYFNPNLEITNKVISNYNAQK